jgi:hypothetical protein
VVGLFPIRVKVAQGYYKVGKKNGDGKVGEKSGKKDVRHDYQS